MRAFGDKMSVDASEPLHPANAQKTRSNVETQRRTDLALMRSLSSQTSPDATDLRATARRKL
jgi:hypothetical protein